jgi:hypothetical protein
MHARKHTKQRNKTMTKTVFSNSMVAHVWAQQKQPEGRSNNGNFHFSGDTIYSYQTPVARIVTGKNKAKIALITSNGYSHTTAGKHLPAIRRSIDYGRSIPYFEVPFLGVTGGRAFRHGDATNAQEVHKGNLAYLEKEYNELKGSISRARSGYSPIIDWLTPCAQTVRAYAITFKLRVPKINEVSDALELEKKRDEREARANTPAAVKKREQAAIYRENKKQREKEEKARREYESSQETFVRWMHDDWSAPSFWRFPEGSPERVYVEDFEARRREERLSAAQDAFLHWMLEGGEIPSDHDLPYNTPERDYLYQAREQARRERDASKRAAWYRGELSYFHFDADCGGAALRIVGEELQTSHGARVPLAHAIRAFRFVKLCREKGEAWHAKGHSIRVGHFTLSSIDAQGNFRAGCHSIKWPEIERVAREAGVFDETASDTALEPSHIAA